MVEFLVWKSESWLTKQDAWLTTVSPSVQSGLQGYAHKQAAIHHNLAISFAKLWYPTLVSYHLEHSWITNYMKKHRIPLPNINSLMPRARGIFKVRVLDKMDGGSQVSTTPLVQPQCSSHIIMGNIMLLEEVDIESDNKSEGGCSEAWDSKGLDFNTDDDDDSFDLDMY